MKFEGGAGEVTNRTGIPGGTPLFLFADVVEW